MIRECGTDSLVIIGSSNSPMSLRHFFSYEERRGFVKKLFPNVAVVGLPDYPTDEEWLIALDDLVLLSGVNPCKAVFYGGCEEDTRFFVDAGRKCSILNRFTGETPKISATEVRDSLIHNRDLTRLLDSGVVKEVKRTFRYKWEEFKRM